MKAPERTTAASYPRHLAGQVVADSAALHWPGLYVRRYRFPRVVDSYLVPATPEPLISCQLKGSAQFRERDVGQSWIVREVRDRDLFVTRSRTPYEVAFRSPAGEELEVIQIHIAIDHFRAALQEVHGRNADKAEVIDYFGRDEALAYFCFACAEMLDAKTAGKSKCIADLAELLATYLAERYTTIASQPSEARGGLPIWRLRKVEDYVSDHIGEEVSVEKLAELVELSPSHFSHVFKESTGMSPLRFVVRERITRAQQLIRETSRSLIEIALDVGYTSPSHFAQVFRRVVGVTPTQFRSAL
jgi:AraC family transcriptional regulator